MAETLHAARQMLGVHLSRCLSDQNNPVYFGPTIQSNKEQLGHKKLGIENDGCLVGPRRLTWSECFL